MTDAKHGKPNLKGAFIAISLFLAAFYWLVVATYPSFFIFNPLDDPWGIRQGALFLSLAGWLAISTVPAVMLFLYALNWEKGIAALPFVALLWPVSVVLNQFLLFIRDGVWYFDYLLNYPIFIASDILLPVLIFVLWLDLRSPKDQIPQHAVREQPAEQS
jgi:hypothetical protein